MNDTFLPGSGFDTYETQDRVLVAMDGTTEAAVAVRILQQQGFGVAGAVVRLDPAKTRQAEAAKAAAEALGIECILLNAEALAQQPEAAGDPGFAALLTAADKLGIQYIAAPRYARVETGAEGRNTVHPPVDTARDESGSIAALPQEVLGRLILPLGDFAPADVEDIQRKKGLPHADCAAVLLLYSGIVPTVSVSCSGDARYPASPDLPVPSRGSAPQRWQC